MKRVARARRRAGDLTGPEQSRPSQSSPMSLARNIQHPTSNIQHPTPDCSGSWPDEEGRLLQRQKCAIKKLESRNWEHYLREALDRPASRLFRPDTKRR